MKNIIVILFMIVIFLPYRHFQISDSLINVTNFRQAQTATIALNFYNSGINLFHTEPDIFGKGKERFLTLEFPFYGAIMVSIYKIFKSVIYGEDWFP